MRRRRNRRADELYARIVDARAHLEEVERRAKLRRSLAGMPGGDLLGMLVDPVGHMNELVERELRKRNP